MAEQAYEPRLKSEYHQRIRAVMKEQFGYTNEMQIPKLRSYTTSGTLVTLATAFTQCSICSHTLTVKVLIL